ncbi:MAG: NUDIX hydrolase [Clostridia bacterium]
MAKFVKLKKLTQNKYLNMFVAEYDLPNGKMNYEFASRKKDDELTILTGKTSSDAVRAIPYFEKNGKTFVVLIKEYRFAINKFIYGVPAGLVDNGEKPEEAMKRELLEEIGAKTLEIKKTEKACFSSAGLSDEAIEFFEAKVELTEKQKLEPTENITKFVIELGELNKFLDENEFCMQSKLQLRSFYYKKKLEKFDNKEM